MSAIAAPRRVPARAYFSAEQLAALRADLAAARQQPPSGLPPGEPPAPDGPAPTRGPASDDPARADQEGQT